MPPAAEFDLSASPVPALKRKIAAILAADVVGYSRLVAADEERTLHDLADARAVFAERVGRGGGRIFNTAGDAVMCEFDSAVEAVRAAIDIQAAIARRGADVPAERRMEFRIGITIGDVVDQDGDLLGDGVNVAARLESMAQPGAICVSRSVHEAVANKVPAVFRDLGERRVKNMPQPVYAYEIAAPAGASSGRRVPAGSPDGVVPERLAGWSTLRSPAAASGSRRSPLLIGGGLVLALVVSVPLVKTLRDTGSSWLGERGAADTAARPAQFEAATPRAPVSGTPRGAGAGQSQTAGADASRAEAPKVEAAKPDVPPTETGRPDAGRPDAGRQEGLAKPESRKTATARTDPARPEAATPRVEKPADPAAAVAQFAALARQGRIADATTLPDLYHNARWLEARGDRAAALKVYAAIAPAFGDFIDPALRYAALLRAANGAAAARTAFAELARNAPSRAVSLAHILQAEPDERRERLEAFAAANPDGGVADYLLGEDYTNRPGGPTLTERRLAFDAYDRFLEADAAGRLQPGFLDAAVLPGWLDGARRRRSEIEAVVTGQPSRPSVAFSRTETGWLATVTLPEPASSVSTRFGERGEFVPTGTGPSTDPRNGKPAPNTRVALPSASGRTTLYVTYADRSGRDAGPFAFPFDARGALVQAEREVLERFPDNWVAFRPDIPDVLSITQLLSNRCAIGAAYIGFGDGPADQALPLPACDERQPTALPADARGAIALPPGVEAVRVRLAYADGTESATRTFRRP